MLNRFTTYRTCSSLSALGIEDIVLYITIYKSGRYDSLFCHAKFDSVTLNSMMNSDILSSYSSDINNRIFRSLGMEWSGKFWFIPYMSKTGTSSGDEILHTHRCSKQEKESAIINSYHDFKNEFNILLEMKLAKQILLTYRGIEFSSIEELFTVIAKDSNTECEVFFDNNNAECKEIIRRALCFEKQFAKAFIGLYNIIQKEGNINQYAHLVNGTLQKKPYPKHIQEMAILTKRIARYSEDAHELTDHIINSFTKQLRRFTFLKRYDPHFDKLYNDELTVFHKRNFWGDYYIDKFPELKTMSLLNKIN